MRHAPKKKCCTRENATKQGSFRRKSDSQRIQRFRCKTCSKSFSLATFHPAYYQKKRHLNHDCKLLLASCVSMRRIGIALNIHPITVARKLKYLAQQARTHDMALIPAYPSFTAIQLDELQSIEHTKCKPLSIVIVVAENGRKILDFRVAIMPATGHLAKISRHKYGPRDDTRRENLHDLLKNLQPQLSPSISIRSDECPMYKSAVKKYFPKAHYEQFKGRKSSVAGQGELKKGWRDPLFCINHTFAMLRANINRLVRKTWCTTKRITRLIDHLYVYCWVHNSMLTPALPPA